MPNNELDEKQLNSVTGGIRREKQIIVYIDVPEFPMNVTIKFYIDGEIDTSKTKVVDSSVKQISCTLNGSGKKDLKIKFNDVISKTYVIDFDEGSYTQID